MKQNLSIPHDFEAEQAIIGSLIEDNSQIVKIINILKTATFHNIAHQYVFKSILDLISDNQLVDEIRNKNQLDLNFKRQNESYLNIDKYLFKFIEPATSLYRDRYTNSIKKYLKLEKIPDYLVNHLNNLIDERNKNINIDSAHISFWKNIFSKDKKTGRTKSLHFIKWHESLQKSREADIFLPPTPYIKEAGGEFLVEKAIEINTDAFDLIVGDVATYFEFDIEIFRNINIINRILNYISENPNKCRFVLFKIHNIDKILMKGELSCLGKINIVLFTTREHLNPKKSS